MIKNRICKERQEELVDKKMKNENVILMNKCEI